MILFIRNWVPVRYPACSLPQCLKEKKIVLESKLVVIHKSISLLGCLGKYMEFLEASVVLGCRTNACTYNKMGVPTWGTPFQ